VRTQTNGVHKRTTFNLVLENVNRIKASWEYRLKQGVL
jgi:hypothetical protein